MTSIERATQANGSIILRLTPDTIRLGGSILSRNQGCNDPLSHEEQYQDLFKTLLRELMAEGAAVLV